MKKYIDESFWRKALIKPDWYLLVSNEFKRLEKIAAQEKDFQKRKLIKQEAYGILEESVKNGNLPIATSGDNLDKDRGKVNKIILHHTKNAPGMSLDRLNAIQLMRIYGSYFANPTDKLESHLKGQPVWSGHFYNNRQVFWGYHWFIRSNGQAEHILKDSYIGWHAGNWEVNKSSVGICVDDDLTYKAPSDTVLKSIAHLINTHYSGITTDNILGHCDVNKNTECPGSQFHENWQAKLLELVKIP